MDCGELSTLILKVLRPLEDARTDDFYKYVIFTKDGIVSYNDRICVYIKYKSDLECVLPAKKFYAVLPKTGEAEIKVVGSKLVMKTPRTTAKVNTVDAPDLIDSIKSMKLKKKRNWEVLPEDFMKAMNMCYPSASKEMNEPAMTCVSISDDVVVATDDVRISEYKMESGIDQEILIPAKTVSELVMYDNLTHFCVFGNWIYFTDSTKSRKFCARIVDAELGEHTENFDFKVVNTLKLPVQETVEAVRYVAPMAVEDEHGYPWMKMTAKKKMITFTTNDPNAGEASSTVKLRSKVKKSSTIYINPGFLTHIIRDAHTMEIGVDRAKFKTDNFTHLVALMKEEGYAVD